MAFFQRWRVERQLQKKAGQYLRSIGREPSSEDVAWLATEATRGDEDHARWELRYARCALGLLIAQRDALDDLTASVVAAAIAQAFQEDARIDPDRLDLAGRQFNARLSAYRDAMGVRGSEGSSRLGQTLLAFAGAAFKGADENVHRAGRILSAYEKEANESLRAVFGAAVLPEHVPPSALAGGNAGSSAPPGR
jgi:hypothetical protein